MAAAKSSNPISVWSWMFMLFVTALPCVGFVMVIVWAFVGDNESKKNYFRALIAWFLIITVIWGGVMALGFWPAIQHEIQKRTPAVQGVSKKARVAHQSR